MSKVYEACVWEMCGLGVVSWSLGQVNFKRGGGDKCG